jgi:hypothetical protein
MKNRHRQWATIRQLRAAVAALTVEQRDRAAKLLRPPDSTTPYQCVNAPAGIEIKTA